MSYNFLADSFHTKNFVTVKRSAILHGKWPFCVFEPPSMLRSNVQCSS